MILRRHGIYYLDIDESTRLSKDEDGKNKLTSFGDFQQIRWVTINPIGKPNRAARRKKINPKAGFMLSNAEDRTKHKRF